MAAEEYILFRGEGIQCKVTNNGSEGGEKCKNIVQGSELLGYSEQLREMQSSLKEEVLPEHDISEESTKQTQSIGLETSTVNTEPTNITKASTPGEMVGVEQSSEAHRRICMVSDMLKIPSTSNEASCKYENNKKENCIRQRSGNAEQVDQVDVNVLQSVTKTVPENSKKVDDETISAETKQGIESEKKIKFIKLKKQKGQALYSDVQSKRATSLDLNVLLVGGLYPGQSGDLKQLLSTTLGARSHIIEPRHKGDAVTRLRFKSKDDMEIAKTLLHNQIFLGSKLTAVVQSHQKQKRKAEKGDETNKPPAKKMKQELLALQSSNVTYKSQIAEKAADVRVKLHLLANVLCGNYPKYKGLITQRQLKNHGLIFPLNKFTVCSPENRFANWCKFSVGTDEKTGLLAVGFRTGSGYVNEVSMVKHSFPPHVIKAAKVFEKMVHAFEQTSEDPEGRCQYEFWHELVIRTSESRELMLIVSVHGQQELAAGRMERLHKELKEFFENGVGKQCGVTSIYTKVTYTTYLIPQQLNLVMGSPYLEETVLDLKFHLSPTVRFWSNIHAAKMVCRGVEEMLTPSKKNTLLEVCFGGHGLVGLYLSRVVGEVLSVGTQQPVEEAQKNAGLNNITNCKYFVGNSEEVIHEVAENIKYDKACAVVICSENHVSVCARAVEELRKVQKVRRLVLVTEMFKSRFNLILTLCNPTNQQGMGNPFFPVRAIPVDMMPNAEGYVLMILMQRTGLLNLPKTLNRTVNNPAMYFTKKGSDSRRATSTLKPYEKQARQTRIMQGDARLKIISRQEKRELLQRKEKRSLGASGKQRFEGRELGKTDSYKQYPTTGELQRPYFDAESNVLGEYHLRELKVEEQKRQMKNEEHLRWTEEEERRRLIKKEEQRIWIEKEEQRRWMEKQEQRKWIEKEECMRQIGEEERVRRIKEEERMRRIEEEVHMRQVEEKELKRQMEEKKLRQVEEERNRQLMRTSVNLRSTNDVQDLIADSLREAAVSQLSPDAAQKLKQLITQAVRSVGVGNPEERQSVVSTSRGFSGIHLRDAAVSCFRGSNKEMPEGDTRYVREVDNMREHLYDAYGSVLGRSEDKQIPHSGHFEEVYSQSVVEAKNVYHYRYGGVVGRDRYQHDVLKPQHSFYSSREVSVPHIGVAKASLQPLKLRELSSVSNNNPRLEGETSSMRHVYCSDVNTNQRQQEKLMLNNYTRHDVLTGNYVRNERQASQDVRPPLHSDMEQETGNNVRLRAQNWNATNAVTNCMRLFSTRKDMACSIPKPPGTEDVYFPKRSSSIFRDSAPGTNFRWQDDTASYVPPETKYSSVDYRDRMQDGQGQVRLQRARYFM